MSVDPLFDLTPDMSPYHYCHNSPLVMVDPSGMKDKNVDRILAELQDNVAICSNEGSKIAEANADCSSGGPEIQWGGGVDLGQLGVFDHMGTNPGGGFGRTGLGVSGGGGGKAYSGQNGQYHEDPLMKAKGRAVSDLNRANQEANSTALPLLLWGTGELLGEIGLEIPASTFVPLALLVIPGDTPIDHDVRVTAVPEANSRTKERKAQWHHIATWYGTWGLFNSRIFDKAGMDIKTDPHNLMYMVDHFGRHTIVILPQYRTQ